MIWCHCISAQADMTTMKSIGIGLELTIRSDIYHPPALVHQAAVPLHTNVDAQRRSTRPGCRLTRAEPTCRIWSAARSLLPAVRTTTVEWIRREQGICRPALRVRCLDQRYHPAYLLKELKFIRNEVPRRILLTPKSTRVKVDDVGQVTMSSIQPEREPVEMVKESPFHAIVLLTGERFQHLKTFLRLVLGVTLLPLLVLLDHDRARKNYLGPTEGHRFLHLGPDREYPASKEGGLHLHREVGGRLQGSKRGIHHLLAQDPIVVIVQHNILRNQVV